jgi:phosphatidylserine synthase 2
MKDMKTNENIKKQDNLNNSKTPQRNVGMQTIMTTKEYLIPSVAVQHNLESEEYPKFIAIPHSLTGLAVLCAILYYFSRTSFTSMDEGLKRGFSGVIITVMAFGCLYLPDSVLRRPHPIFWRAVTSAAILYLCFATFILFLDRDNARQFLSYFDKSLGKPLPEKSYAENCSLCQPEFPYLKLDNFFDSIDVYVTAHLCGWFVKMLIIRDVKLCWILSILFELLEITFRHWLPNFWECWWDHVILDVFGMNALGIWLGSITCNYFEMKNYNWISHNKDSKEKKNSEKGVVKRMFGFVNYFTPNYWVKHEWDLFSSTKRFYQVLWFFFILNITDLSHFFLKYVLWLPPSHWILAIRIYIVGFLAMISAREYYEYISNPSCKRFGLNIWIAHLILFVEWSYIYKFSDGLFTAPFPWYVVWGWTLVFLLFTGITIHLVVKDALSYFKNGKRTKKVDLTEPEIEIENVDVKN